MTSVYRPPRRPAMRQGARPSAGELNQRLTTKLDPMRCERKYAQWSLLTNYSADRRPPVKLARIGASGKGQSAIFAVCRPSRALGTIEIIRRCVLRPGLPRADAEAPICDRAPFLNSCSVGAGSAGKWDWFAARMARAEPAGCGIVIMRRPAAGTGPAKWRRRGRRSRLLQRAAAQGENGVNA